MRFLLSFPLLAFVFIAYNVMVFMGNTDLGYIITQFTLTSDAVVSLTRSDILILMGLFLLFIEVMKAAAFGNATIVDHMLSTVIFIAALVEFLIVDLAGTSTFLILVVMSLIDVVAGYTISIRTARRDVGIGGF